MTSSYLFLNRPDGALPEETRTIRDGFSLVAYIFPWIWLASHQLWLHAIAAFALQAIGGGLIELPGLAPLGTALVLGVGILVGLEGQNFRIQDLIRKGWKEEGLVRAESLDVAEEIYFSTVPSPVKSSEAPSPDWDRKGPSAQHGHSTSLGLFGFDGGR